MGTFIVWRQSLGAGREEAKGTAVTTCAESRAELGPEALTRSRLYLDTINGYIFSLVGLAVVHF